MACFCILPGARRSEAVGQAVTADWQRTAGVKSATAVVDGSRPLARGLPVPRTPELVFAFGADAVTDEELDMGDNLSAR